MLTTSLVVIWLLLAVIQDGPDTFPTSTIVDGSEPFPTTSVILDGSDPVAPLTITSEGMDPI